MPVVRGDGAYAAFTALLLRLKIFNQKVRCGEKKKKVKVMEIETSRVIGREWKDRRKRKEKELKVCNIDFLLILD